MQSLNTPVPTTLPKTSMSAGVLSKTTSSSSSSSTSPSGAANRSSSPALLVGVFAQLERGDDRGPSSVSPSVEGRARWLRGARFAAYGTRAIDGELTADPIEQEAIESALTLRSSGT